MYYWPVCYNNIERIYSYNTRQRENIKDSYFCYVQTCSILTRSFENIDLVKALKHERKTKCFNDKTFFKKTEAWKNVLRNMYLES
jgi:hypothetical protein